MPLRPLLPLLFVGLLASPLAALDFSRVGEPEVVATVPGGSLEGPAWSEPEQALYFSCQSGVASVLGVYRWTAAEGAARRWSANNKVNGNAVDADGRIITCESGNRRLVRRTPAGVLEVLAAQLGEAPLNEPNDVAVAPDGALWFTTPSWSLAEAGRQYVLRLDPRDGSLQVRVRGVDKPNGLAFSPDGAWLYLNDNGANRVLRYPHRADGSLGDEEVLAADLDQWPDGLAVDAEGNLFVALWGGSEAGVLVLAPDGRWLGLIAIPGLSQGITNTEFGGPERRLLFITAGESLWRLDLTKAYAPPAPQPSLTCDTAPWLEFSGRVGLSYRIERWEDPAWTLLAARADAGLHRVALPTSGALVRVLAQWQTVQ